MPRVPQTGTLDFFTVRPLPEPTLRGMAFGASGKGCDQLLLHFISFNPIHDFDTFETKSYPKELSYFVFQGSTKFAGLSPVFLPMPFSRAW